MKKLRIGFFVLIGLVVIGISSVRIYNRNLMTVSGENMLPTLAPGDVIEIDRDAFKDRAPERGEIVIYFAREGETVPHIGRVVGVPGDRVAFIGGKLHVNDVPAQQSTDLVDGKEQAFEMLGTQQFQVWYRVDSPSVSDIHASVKEGEYFIAGDNRDNSSDSRFLGAIPMSRIQAAVLKKDADK